MLSTFKECIWLESTGGPRPAGFSLSSRRGDAERRGDLDRFGERERERDRERERAGDFDRDLNNILYSNILLCYIYIYIYIWVLFWANHCARQ